MNFLAGFTVLLGALYYGPKVERLAERVSYWITRKLS